MSPPGRPKGEYRSAKREGTPMSARLTGGRAEHAPAPPPTPWLQTLRLDLRELVAGDLDDEYRLDSDPRVMRYISGGKPATRDEVAAAIRRILRVYRLYPGLGTWRAERRDTGAYIGWFTLKYIPKTVEVEVGYRLLREAWGQGFATEGARELVRYGFEDLGLYRIVGLTHKDNAASQRVLTKAGLAASGWGRYYGRRLRVFAAINPRP
jgi:RimJ/RimL family protein N-acetyltransferase